MTLTSDKESHDSAELQLLDMPECILQDISRSISGNQWALGAACTCRTLNRLPLPVMKVTHCERRDSQHHLRELFTWVGKRIRDTIHLSIYIKYPVWDSQSLRWQPKAT
ncbi:g2365 [Coccomyxa viridis]|uniref:G2365 protein n=1 Tax=Coccomyxa viridis TaxID=1274662 RepID=A0ABP1FMH3_9CHLO